MIPTGQEKPGKSEENVIFGLSQGIVRKKI